MIWGRVGFGECYYRFFVCVWFVVVSGILFIISFRVGFCSVFAFIMAFDIYLGLVNMWERYG